MFFSNYIKDVKIHQIERIVKMVSKKNLLNIFLSDLAVMNIKLHNLHWNVTGSDFIIIHKLTEKLYKKLQEQFDSVAEIMKMQNEKPFATMKDYLENTNIEEIESRDYSSYEVLEELNSDCHTLIDLAQQIRNEANKKDNFLVANLFEEYISVYTKKSWIIETMLQEGNITLDEETDSDD